MARRNTLKNAFNTLTGRLAFGILLIHALLIPALFGGLVLYANDAFRSSFVNKVRNDAQLLGWLAAKNMESDRLESFLYEGMLSGTLVFARVTDQANRQLVELTAADAGGEFVEDFFFSQHDDDVYYIAVPIIRDDFEELGMLYLGYDEASTRNLIERVNQRATWFAFGYVALTLLMVVFWGQHVSRPLRLLQQQSRRVASGQFREHLSVPSRLAEVSALAHDLNVMRKELVRKTDSMEHLALHDSMTGLPNRALLEDRVEQAIAIARREQQSVGLVVIDLDHFKEINDTLGHFAGDRVLKQAASRLQSGLRTSDTVARLGGDEFAIVLSAADDNRITHVLDKLCESMHRPFELGGQSFHVGLSGGVALYPAHGDDFQTLLQRADSAMYAAKKRHKDCVFYDPSLEAQDIDKLALATELRHDIRLGALKAYYQSIISLPDRKIAGYEALARWHHKDRGLLLPDVFIPLADKLGLIGELTVDILTRSFEEYERLSVANAEPILSVNLSAGLLQEDYLPDTIGRLLREHAMPASRLTLEVTENEVMADPERALEMLTKLRALGVRLAIDDFGTGYSSLEYLKNLPVDAVKIDKSFVWEMTHNPRDAKIVRAIINLCHALEIRVFAEGVQDEETLQLLADAGCDYAQGFVISEPVPVELLGTYD